MTDTIFQPGEYVTRDGRKARVYATDGGEPWVLHGAIWNDEWIIATWLKNGRSGFGGETQHDLMPPKQVRYVNVYEPYDVAGAWATRKMADEVAGKDRIACIRIEFTEGQYDD